MVASPVSVCCAIWLPTGTFRALWHTASMRSRTNLAELPHNVDPLRTLRPARRRTERVTQEDLSLDNQHEFLDAVQSDLARIHDSIAREYFHLHQRELAAEAAS